MARHRSDAPSGISVFDHFKALLAEKDLRDQQRFEAQSTAISAAMLAAEKAVTKAEVAGDKRFELLNELRTGVATMQQVDALDKRINELTARVDRTEGRSTGLSSGWAYFIAGAGVLVAVIALVVHLHS